MKRFLSLLLVLLLTFAGAAFAESEDSGVSYLVLMDPIVSANDQILLDMTGLYLEIDGTYADSAASAIIVANAGEDYGASVVAAQIQLADNALVMALDGLSNLYKLSLADLGGADLSAAFVQGAVPTPEESLMAIIDSLTVSSADGEYTLALSKEDGRKILEPMIAAIQGADAALGSSVNHDLDGLGLEMNGKATVSDDGAICLQLTGELSMEGERETVPVSLDCDLTADSLDFVLNISPAGDNQAVASYTADIGTDEDGFYLSGYLSGALTDGKDSYGIDTYLNLGSYTTPASDWLMDGSSAIDVMSMTETQTSALQMGAIGVLGNAVTALQENVPGLAEVIRSLASGLMS